MKLLFDQNLSPELAGSLADVFRGSMHVRQAGLERATDHEAWRYALWEDLAIVTKDSDFQERSQIAPTAPKVIWVRRGNCSTADIEALMRKHAARIVALGVPDAEGFLILL